MKTQDFNFSLPPGLIAQFPITKRAGSRMLCLDGKKGALQDAMFVDLPKYMQSGDVIIFNDCLLYTSPSQRDGLLSRMPSYA